MDSVRVERTPAVLQTAAAPSQLTVRITPTGLEPGSSAWKADVLTVTPHGRKQVTGPEPVNSPWQSDALPITRYLQKASRRIRTDSLLITKQLRFRCAREAKSELQESNLRKLLIRQVPYHWTKLQ